MGELPVGVPNGRRRGKSRKGQLGTQWMALYASDADKISTRNKTSRSLDVFIRSPLAMTLNSRDYIRRKKFGKSPKDVVGDGQFEKGQYLLSGI
jgi:hypothetical protein